MAAAATDDRTFVLAAQDVSGSSPGCGPTRLFLARLNPADRHVTLTALPVRELQATRQRDGIALTGKVLATLRPAGGFASVSRAADDRTFVLAAARKSLIALYLLRLTPQAGTARLNARPITVPTGGSLQFAGLALSPDGTQLAVGVNNFWHAGKAISRTRHAARRRLHPAARPGDCADRGWRRVAGKPGGGRST
jgi:hypothetical protein